MPETIQTMTLRLSSQSGMHFVAVKMDLQMLFVAVRFRIAGSMQDRIGPIVDPLKVSTAKGSFPYRPR